MPTKAEKEGWLPAIPTNTAVSSVDIPQFDLQKLNFVQVATDLSRMLNKPQPRTWIGKYFNERRTRLDNEQLSQMVAYVKQFRELVEQTTNLQAELFLSPSVLQNIIEKHYAAAKREAEIQFKDHEEALKLYEHREKHRELEGRLVEAKIKGVETENRINETRAKLIDRIANEIDPKEINQSTAIMVMNLLNPGNQHAIDFMTQEFLLTAKKEEFKVAIDKMAAEAEKAHGEAKRVKVQANLDEAHAKSEMRELDCDD